MTDEEHEIEAKKRKALVDMKAGHAWLIEHRWQKYPHPEQDRNHYMKVLPVSADGIMGHVEPRISEFGVLIWNAWLGPMTQVRPPMLVVQDKLRVSLAPCWSYENITEYLLNYAQALQDIVDREQAERRQVRDELLEYIHCKVWQTDEPELPETIGEYETIGRDVKRI